MYYLVLCGKISHKYYYDTPTDGHVLVNTIHSDGYIGISVIELKTLHIPDNCVEFDNIPDIKKYIKNNKIYFDNRNLPNWFDFTGSYKLIKKNYTVIDVVDGALDI